jgi:excisionase family DNA binding protein
MKCIEEPDAPSVRPRDAAHQLGVSFRDLYGLIDAGKLPAYKVGRDVMLRQVDIDDYSRNHPSSG